jgi:predicted  nucleic acid-binding Zn-ribbon protein
MNRRIPHRPSPSRSRCSRRTAPRALARRVPALVFLLLLLPTLAEGAAGAADKCTPEESRKADPKVAPDSVCIQLPGEDGRPGEIPMRFRAVHLGLDGTRLFASRELKLGLRTEDVDLGKGAAAPRREPSYKEQLMTVKVAGGLVGERNGRPDWLYYLEETEVQRRQWNAVMRWLDRKEGRKPPPQDDSRLPQTGVTVAQIHRFIEGLNSWMLGNQEQRERIPRLGAAFAYCRLPTEAEWAFAARGGIDVFERDFPRFNRPYPYSDELGKHEWYRDNAGGEVQECGSQYMEPNPVGLYDMLGNVQELTISLFGPEYVQGRFGQLAVRGGSYADREPGLAASRRTELAPYDTRNGEAIRDAKLGFRLLLATSIAATGTPGEELDEAFTDYTAERALTRPGPSADSSPLTQSLEDRMTELSGKVLALESDKARLTKEAVALRDQLNSARDKARTAQGRSDDLLAEQDLLQRRIADLEEAGLQARVAGLERQLSGVREGVTGDQQDLEGRLARKEQEIARLESRLAGAPNPAEIEGLKGRLAQLEADKARLEDRVAELQRGRDASRAYARDSELEIQRLSEELRRKEQQLADAGRQRGLVQDLVRLDEGRVRAVEKRYLEALMRQASANAGLAWRDLRRREILLPSRGAEDRRMEELWREAANMVADYWALVVLMADRTRADLFPEVKAELADWLRDQEQRTGNHPAQRKALDLIERHVADVRAGRFYDPKDLLRAFTKQPEMFEDN